ncbi:UDP-N-acetylmuramoyl-tripeptide--D-alanyl-D-alanine ligase, partial [Neisseria arctica]
LTRIAEPDTALVNNALRAHVGCGFNGVGEIAKAKSEIYQGVAADGLALIPCDDAYAEVFAEAAACLRKQTCGVKKGE